VISRRVTVGGHEIPDWARCYCVTRHVPTYPYPLPYFLPDGNVLYLCPNMHLSVTALLQTYEALGGRPDRELLEEYPKSTQRLVRMLWAMKHDGLTSDEYLQIAIFNQLNGELK
jgi:hypothetical protein